MDVQTIPVRRIPRLVAIVAIAAIVGSLMLTAGYKTHWIPVPVVTKQGLVAPASRSVSTAPWVLPVAEGRILARRGATSQELAAENLQRWRRLQVRMLDEPWVVGILKHRPGMTPVDLLGAYRSMRPEGA